MMKKYFVEYPQVKSRLLLSLLFILIGTSSSNAQGRELPVDTMMTATGQVTVKGENVPYDVMYGTQPVYGEEGAPITSCFIPITNDRM